MSNNYRTLVLNNQYLPLSIFPLYTIPAEDAIARYLNERCHVVAWYDHVIQTPSRTDLRWPSVIVNYNGQSFRKEVRLKKESLFYRDQCKCVYCGNELTIKTLTYDHVLPKSKGGKHQWHNVVASCKACNSDKDDSTSPSWKPKSKPWNPTFYQMLEIRKKFPLVVYDEQWIQFLPNWVGEITVRKTPSVVYNNKKV